MSQDRGSRTRLNEYLRSLAADVLYLVDERAEPELGSLDVPMTDIPPGSLDPLPPGELFRPPLIARAIDRDARASRVVLTATGLAQQLGGQVWTLEWSDVAGVLRDPDGDLVVLAEGGAAITIGPDLYRGGKKLVDAVHRHVPAELVWDDPIAEPPSDERKYAR
jgi:hypothetical protein